MFLPDNPWPATLWQEMERAARAACAGRNAGHDYGHVERVTRAAAALASREPCDRKVVLAAALLHELVNHPKHHERSPMSGDDCARAAGDLLAALGVDPAIAERVSACIANHGWSAGKAPPSLEAAVLQDADRLDALGAIGLARCVATGVEMGAALFHPDDPFAQGRELNDKSFSLDHLARKLFKLSETFHTAAAREMGLSRAGFLRLFVIQLAEELGTKVPPGPLWGEVTSPP
jgi:uncharacterized protein